MHQIEPVYHLESSDHLVPEKPKISIHGRKISEGYHPWLVYKSDHVPQTNLIYLTPERNLEPAYLPTPLHHITPEIDHEPEYFPEPEYPYQTMDNQTSFHSESSNIVYPEPMADIPSEPDRPIGSDHSSLDDNREYFQLLNHQDDLEIEICYEPNILRHVLNTNQELVDILRSTYFGAERYNSTPKDTYFRWLGKVKKTYRRREIDKLPYPVDDWVMSTLYLFPREHFWMNKTNEILEGERPVNFHSFLLFLQGLVLDNM